jgi:hypothetical protein
MLAKDRTNKPAKKRIEIFFMKSSYNYWFPTGSAGEKGINVRDPRGYKGRRLDLRTRL